MGQVTRKLLGLAYGYVLGRSSACRLACLRVSPSGQFGALVFRHLSIQLELRYLGMERQTVTFITLYV